MTDNKTPSATPHKGFGPFPAFRLTNGVINASDGDLERSVESCERWAEGSALAVIAGLVLEVGIAFTHPPFDSFWEHWGAVVADTAVALGVAGEVLFGRIGRRRQNELSRRSKEKLAEAIDRATELESKLQPRQINQEQWDAIQALSGQYDFVNIVCETDAETKLLVKSLSDAFLTAQIGVASYGLEPGIHGIGVLVYEPKGYDGARPRTVGPLIDILQMSAATLPVHIITELPGYAVLPISHGIGETGRGTLDAPAIIIGGRFILPPAHWPESRPKAKGG